eukprot:1330038-Pleurochrysis_carterae.AAC.3
MESTAERDHLQDLLNAPFLSATPSICELPCTMHPLSSSRSDHKFDHGPNLPLAQKTSRTYDAEIRPPGCHDLVQPASLASNLRASADAQSGMRRQPLAVSF